jgi:AraC-like DNA-binding protein
MKKAKNATETRLQHIGLKRPRAEAFAYADDLHNVAYDWHSHSYHQLLYSFSGVTRLETRAHLWLLPPQRAAWIPAGVRHRTTLYRVTACSIFFQPGRYAFAGLDRIAIFTATPLLREMISFGQRWTNRARSRDPLAENFFRTAALYCRELARTELPYSLPRGRSKAVCAAVNFTVAHLEAVTISQVAHASALSVRTLRRHFLAEIGLSWRDFLTRARLLRAVELLVDGKSNVTETAYACGFTNLSAFSKAFSNFAGQNPAVFRRNRRSG